MLCLNNMADGPVGALIGLLDVADSTRARSPLTPISLAAHQGACLNLPITTTTADANSNAHSAIAAVWVSNGSGADRGDDAGDVGAVKSGDRGPGAGV